MHRESPVGSDPLGSPSVAKPLQDTAAPSPRPRAKFQLQNLGRGLTPAGSLVLAAGAPTSLPCASTRPKEYLHPDEFTLQKSPDAHRRRHWSGDRAARAGGTLTGCAGKGKKGQSRGSEGVALTRWPEGRCPRSHPTAPGCGGWQGAPLGRRRAGGGSRPALGLAKRVGNLVNQVSGAPAPPIQPPLRAHPCPAKPLGDEETLLYSQPAAQASPEPRDRERKECPGLQAKPPGIQHPYKQPEGYQVPRKGQ